MAKRFALTIALADTPQKDLVFIDSHIFLDRLEPGVAIECPAHENLWETGEIKVRLEDGRLAIWSEPVFEIQGGDRCVRARNKPPGVFQDIDIGSYMVDKHNYSTSDDPEKVAKWAEWCADSWIEHTIDEWKGMTMVKPLGFRRWAHFNVSVFRLDRAVCWNCDDCFVKTKKCGRCRTARYCSRECQRNHWMLHKTFCCPFDELCSS